MIYMECLKKRKLKYVQTIDKIRVLIKFCVVPYFVHNWELISYSLNSDHIQLDTSMV